MLSEKNIVYLSIVHPRSLTCIRTQGVIKTQGMHLGTRNIHINDSLHTREILGQEGKSLKNWGL
jgi:hypothetical protein